MSQLQAELIQLDTEFRANEAGLPGKGERAWSAWMRAAEKLAISAGGFREVTSPRVSPLDGDEPSGDCYSIDGAYDAFEAGKTAEAYIAACIARMGAR